MSNNYDIDIINGYKDLAEAVITDTLNTIKNGGGKRRALAMLSLYSERFELWCSMVDYDVNTIREYVKNEFSRKESLFK